MKKNKILIILFILASSTFDIAIAANPDEYNTLREADNAVGNRLYNLPNATEYLDGALNPMGTGTLTIKGSGDNSVLSGAINGDVSQRGNFFVLAQSLDHTLNLQNFTIQDASKTGGEGSVILLYADNVANLDNMIIKNNTVTDRSGGAISVNNSTLNINNSQFIDNSAGSSAGAIIVRGENSKINIDNTLFEGNNAYLTGAFFIEQGDLNLTNSVFKDNYSTTTTLDGGNPGALRLGRGDSNSYIDNCTFEHNISAHNAGAVYSYGNTVIKDSRFIENEASFRGGALINGLGANTVITGSLFDYNSANEIAGAIYNDGNLDIDTTTISNNSSNHHVPTATDGKGGAIYNSGTGVLNLNSGTLINSNTAEGDGGAIASQGTLNINGATIDGNTSNQSGGAIWTTSSAETHINGGTSIINNTAATNGGAISNQGTLYLTSNETGNIKFDNNKANGIYNDIYGNNSTNKIYIDGESGTTSISGGFAGQGEVTKSNNGIFILQGDSSNYTGNFTQSGGATGVTNGKWFGGTSTINGGTLEWGENAQKVKGQIAVNSGNLLVQPDAILDLNNTNDTVEADAFVYLDKDAIINNSGTINLDKQDRWNGTINNKGVLKLDNVINNTANFNQNSGQLIMTNGSQITTGGNTNISGGNIDLNTLSQLNIGTNNFTADYLSMDNGIINSLNGTTTNNYVNNDFTVGSGGAHFNVDFNGDTKESDRFIINGDIIPNGEISIDNYAVSGAPVEERIDFPVFTGGNIDNAIFTAVDDEVNTPIYRYKLVSSGSGLYSLIRQETNPSINRGVNTIESVFLNNLLVTNLIFEHVYIDSEELTYLRNQKNYSNIFYAPYQQSDNEEGSIWVKPYISYDRFSLTNNNMVYNTAYGTIIGFDFPTEQINKEWKFLPTAFLTYQGATQSANHNSYYQNGGMGGVMGTFFHGESISSIMAYAGGYGNEMQYDGYTDTTGNWYAGCAAISAYNFHPKKNIILQPILWGAYNILGKQNWTAENANVPMSTGYLNGLAIAPGINAFYGSDTWSIYGTISYLFTINDHVKASAGPVTVDDGRLRYGYLQYGVGFIKKIKDRFLAYGQVTLRNGGMTGVAFWGGCFFPLLKIA